MKQTMVLPLVLILGVLIINPTVLSYLGVDLEASTQAVRIYLWYLDVFLLVLALLNLPWPIKWLKTAMRYFLMFMLIIGSVEIASAIAYRVLFGHWSHMQYVNLNKYMFESHPYLVGSLRKGIAHERDELTYSHNSKGYRSKEYNDAKTEGQTRVLTMGGSTTYGVGVNNNETWPYYLDSILGNEFEVINLGVPGYTSAENLIQTALHVSDLNPDIIVYFIGLNDLRNVNVEGLAPDYSDFHARALYGALGLCNNENVPSLATIKMGLVMCQRMGLLDVCPNQGIEVTARRSSIVDQRALGLYERNLESIVALCRNMDIIPILAPQILLEEVLITGNYNWWIPFVKNTDMDDMMRAFNDGTRHVAENNSVLFVNELSEHPWEKQDFVDMSHFNPSANRTMADIVAKAIEQQVEQVLDTNKVGL